MKIRILGFATKLKDPDTDLHQREKNPQTCMELIQIPVQKKNGDRVVLWIQIQIWIRIEWGLWIRIRIQEGKNNDNNCVCTGRVPDPTSLFLPTSFCM
jgi:hypothetical protein